MKERKGTLCKCHVISRCGTHREQCKLKWVFEERGKPEYPGKTAQSRVEKQQTQPTYDVESGYGIRGHIDGRRVLSPLRHHCSPQDKKTSVSKCKWFSMVALINIRSPYKSLNVKHQSKTGFISFPFLRLQLNCDDYSLKSSR